jgi:flagellar basal body-associated protein FliL
MKQCPVCKSVYTDDTLSFCLNDGAALTAPSSSSQETQRMSFGTNETQENNPPIRVEFQSETPTRFSAPKNTTQTEGKSFSPLAILSIVVLLFVIGIAAVAAAYFAFVRRENPTVVSQTNTTPAQNNNSNETQELKKELERLKKQVEEQKNAKTNPTPSPTSTPPIQTTVTARVNSPNDGFLALRTAPSVQSGSQILQIPHGAIVTVFDCQGYSTIGNRRGRWCRVKYDNQQGWSFDAFLVY